MLFRRRDYERIGGHASVRNSLVEDVALARVTALCGLCVHFLRGEEHLQVRMYRDLGSLWEGFSKNVFRFVHASPRGGMLTVLASIVWSAALPMVPRFRSPALALGLLLAPALGLLPWERRFGVPLRFAALHPLAAGVFQLLALDSMRRSLTGVGTVWKGRRY
jgi:hypothetical protein